MSSSGPSTIARQPWHFESAVSRRDFLARAGGGFGAVALASLLASEAGAAASTSSVGQSSAAPRRRIFGPRATQRDLVLHRRRAEPHRPVRSQARSSNKLAGQPLPDSFERPITAMGRTAYTPLLATQAQVRPARSVGHLGQRLVSGNRHLRRRPGRGPQLPCRRAEPRRQRLPDEHRQHPGRPAVARAPGACTDWAASATTCPASSC